MDGAGKALCFVELGISHQVLPVVSFNENGIIDIQPQRIPKPLLGRGEVGEIIGDGFVASPQFARPAPGEEIGRAIGKQAVPGVEHFIVGALKEVSIQFRAVFAAVELQVIVGAQGASGSTGIKRLFLPPEPELVLAGLEFSRWHPRG